MNTLFNTEDVNRIQARIDKLSNTSERLWGKMNVSAMLAHCNVSLETAMGKNTIKQVFLGKIIGPLMKKSVIGHKPFSRNSPTDKTYIFKGVLDFNEERLKLKNTVQEFYNNGIAGCTKFPHPFFGHFTPGEWGIFQWKHLDHHLRQFGV